MNIHFWVINEYIPSLLEPMSIKFSIIYNLDYLILINKHCCEELEILKKFVPGIVVLFVF
jgi:hypothetical protein